MHTHQINRYNIYEGTWGIAIIIEGCIKEFNTLDNENYLKVNESIFVHIEPDHLIDEEIKIMVSTIEELSLEIENSLLINQPISIIFKEIILDNAHYQAEGLFCAVELWIRKIFNLKSNIKYKLKFKIESNKYQLF